MTDMAIQHITKRLMLTRAEQFERGRLENGIREVANGAAQVQL